jgi:hypothetical protein
MEKCVERFQLNYITSEICKITTYITKKKIKIPNANPGNTRNMRFSVGFISS